MDGIGEFEHKEAILGIFKTDDSTLRYIYKGTGDKIECRHYSNPSVFDIAVKAG